MLSRHSAAATLLTLTAGFAAGCGPAPTEPAAPAGAAAPASSSHSLVFPLAAGTLALESPNGSLLATYTGEVSGIGDSQAALVAVLVTEGTGQYAGASGTLSGTGGGAFVGEGPFSLFLEGSLSTDRGRRTFRASLRGSSSVTCREGTVVVLQSGSGAAAGLGRVSARMRHDIAANAGCEDD